MMNLNFNTKKIGFFAISGIIVLLIILAFTTKEEENITQVDSSALEVQVATPVYDKITEWTNIQDVLKLVIELRFVQG